jgi:type II secretory pathway predicted ATPase ExeA
MRASLQGKGLSLVTGEGGVGKTVLVRHFLEALEEEVFEACMLVPIPGVTDGQWILDRFARQLGVEEPAAERQVLMAQIYEQLAIVREDGRQTVLIFDEAQVLAEQGLLGELRGLLNLEYEDRRMLCVVLVGLPSLDDAIAAEPALCDRIDQRIELKPLDEKFAVQYLSHRILTAGGNPAILDASAVQALVKASKGIPRYLNTLADNALFEAHVAGRVSASAGDVEQAAAELRPWAEDEDGDEPAPIASSSAPASPPHRETTASAAMAQPAQAARAPEPVEAPSFEMAEVIASETEPPVAGTPSASGGEDAQWLDDSPSARQQAAPTSPAKPTSGMGELLGEEPPARGELDDLFVDLVK